MPQKKSTKKREVRRSSAKAKPKKELTPDETAQVGAFAEVVEGEHVGTYGVVLSRKGDNVVFRSRDGRGLRFVLPLDHLRPSSSGKF